MVSPGSCPRCSGTLLNGCHRFHDDNFCFNCGWQSLDLPDKVLSEFLKHHCDSHLEGYKARNNIGTSRPAKTSHER